MSEQLKESLSAVMDDEADEFEIRRVLNEAASDPELRGVWERFHLVRSVMRGDGRLRTTGTLSAQFWSQIDVGEAPDADSVVESTGAAQHAPRPAWVAWGQRVAGVAVAAGVAAAVILGFGVNDNAVVLAPKIAVVEPAAAVRPQAAMAMFDDEVDSRANLPASVDRQRAQAYMLHHANHLALTNGGVVPFVKVAAFESQ